MSSDPEQEHFADGLAEDLITDLSKVPGLLVIARNSSFIYKGRSVDIRSVARDLGVRYVIEGSVRRAATRVRINAQLIKSWERSWARSGPQHFQSSPLQSRSPRRMAERDRSRVT